MELYDIVDGKVIYNNGTCKIQIVSDDDKSLSLSEDSTSVCGGLNVTFDGVYTNQTPK